MTANMIKGKGFRGALRYNLEKVEKNVAEVLDHSFVDVREKSIMKEIQMIRIMRPNLQKYFYHTSINFPPCEELTNAAMTQIGQDYLREAGFTQHQYIMFRHYDASHPHLHILVNRIGYDGKVLSDSNDFAKCEKILRELEKKYKLTEVMSSNQGRKRAVKKDEIEMMKRKNVPSHKVALQKIIENILTAKPKLSCSEFVQQLNARNVNVLFNQASTGYVSGISYSYDGITITGSKLGNDFKWTTLKGKLDYNQERDRTIIDLVNARTKYSKTQSDNYVNPATNYLLKTSKTLDSISPTSKVISTGKKTNEQSKHAPHPFESVMPTLLHVEEQSNVDPENALKLNRKRKRRIARL